MDSRITVSGNVGGVVEFVDDQSFDPRAVFHLAYTPRQKRDGEWYDTTTIWFRVTCWRRLARNVAASLAKGDAVVVTGKVSAQEWIGKDGHSKQGFNIEADSVGHDLNRGTAVFTRAVLRRDLDEPSNLTAWDIERIADEERLDAAVIAEAEAATQEAAFEAQLAADGYED